MLNDNDDESENIQFEADNDDHDVDSTDEFDGTSSRDSTSELINNDFDFNILFFNYTTANNFNADDRNDNNCVIIDECSLFIERRKFVSSCCDFIFDCDHFDKLKDDYIFNVFATDDDENDENSRFTKRRKLSATFCRNLCSKITIFELQDDKSD